MIFYSRSSCKFIIFRHYLIFYLLNKLYVIFVILSSLILFSNFNLEDISFVLDFSVEKGENLNLSLINIS